MALQKLVNVHLLPFFECLGHDAVILLRALFKHPLHFSKHDRFILTMTQDAANCLLFGVEDGTFKLVGNAVDTAALLGQQGELPDFKVLRGGYACYAAQSVPDDVNLCPVEVKAVAHAPDEAGKAINIIIAE
ncbi:MAG: hypothetical protein ACMX3H_20020 [Sodalis sp. (in: enterobacteria)]